MRYKKIFLKKLVSEGNEIIKYIKKLITSANVDEKQLSKWQNIKRKNRQNWTWAFNMHFKDFLWNSSRFQDFSVYSWNIEIWRLSDETAMLVWQGRISLIT